MPEDPIATIIAANDPEGANVSWRDVANTPVQFLNWLVKRIAVDFSRVKSLIPIIISKTKPSGADSGKIHIQNTINPRIGINTETGYKYFDRYPRNVVMGWRGSDTIPSFFTVISDTEVTSMGLPPSIDGKIVWVVYPE